MSAPGPPQADAAILPSSRPAPRRELLQPGTLLVGLLFTGLMARYDPLNGFLKTSPFGGFHFSIGPMLAVLVWALGVNVVLRWLAPRWAWSPGQVAALWALTAVPLGTALAYLVPNVVAFHYYASPANGWDRLLGAEIAPALLVQPVGAVKGFFEGLPAGARIPWGAWVTPVATWSLFAFAMYATMLGMSVLLRRRWVEEEHFTFPLVQVPLEVAASPAPGRLLNPLLRSGMMWTAVLVLFAIHSVRALHTFYPSVPTVTLSRWFPLTERPWSFAQNISLIFLPMMIGLSYLLASEVSFSLWFFYLAQLGQKIVMGLLGFSMDRTGSLYGGTLWASLEEAGGTIALACWFVWLARHHFRRAFRKALTGDPAVNDAAEPLSYRAATALFLGGVLVMIGWLSHFGGSPLMAVGAVLGSLATFLTLGWAISQGGLFYVNPTFCSTEVIANLTGGDRWGIRPLLINMWNEEVFRLDLRDYLLPYLLNAHKLTDGANLNRRSLLSGCTATFLLAFAVSQVMQIWLRYAHGGLLGLPNTWLPRAVQTHFNWVAAASSYPETFSPGNLAHFGGGALFTLLLAWLRPRYSWFGLHPIGFVLASGYPAGYLWFSLFLGWLVKSSVLRWGGYKTYQHLRPLFMGLVIGDCISAAVWNVVGYLTGVGYSVIP